MRTTGVVQPVINGVGGGAADSGDGVTNSTPSYGRRLLPQVVDQEAKDRPDRVYCSIPLTTNVLDGFHDITISQLARAVDGVAWWFWRRFGSSRQFDTVAYIGFSDIRYTIIFLAAVKCGWKLLCLSPRNPATINSKLLERADCELLLYSDEMADTVQSLIQRHGKIKSKTVETLENMLKVSFEPFYYTKSFEEAKDDPIVVLHSSGSTGAPKLVTMTNGTITVADNDRNLPVPEGRKGQNNALFDFDKYGGGKFYSCFPPYHLAGMQAQMIIALLYNATIVFSPPQLPPTGFILADLMTVQKLRGIYVPPSIIDQWLSTRVGLEQAKDLDWVLFSGGPLPTEVGNELSRFTDVCQVYGGLETGQIQSLVPLSNADGEWNYFEWNPNEEVDMQPRDDNAYELVLHQKPHLEKWRSLTYNFPDVREWKTGDLFVPHPRKPGLWRFAARVDDLLILSSGHKFQPIAMETQIESHKLVKGAMVAGQGKPRPVLLLERAEIVQNMQKHEFINQVWPQIEEANSRAPEYGRIGRTKIIVTDGDRPFARAPKGTVVRKLTTQAYKKEIEAVFSYSEQYFPPPAIEPKSLDEVRDGVRESVHSVFSRIQFEDDEDYFVKGMDSLQVAELVTRLQYRFRSWHLCTARFEAFRLVYSNPTINKLSRALAESLLKDITPQDPRTPEQVMQSMVDSYTTKLPKGKMRSYGVVLIGSRGNLGPQILRALLHDPRITKIFCLNRKRERVSFAGRMPRGVCRHKSNEKVEDVVVDLSEERLGLSDEMLLRLQQEAHFFIHNAWRVDFNLSVESFEHQYIKSIDSLVRFSNDSPLNPRIVFVSSIASVGDWPSVYGKAPVPTTNISSYHVAAGTGYAMSKHIAERILTNASQIIKVPVTILRVSQIAGPMDHEKGRWAPNEWVPALVHACKTLKMIPSPLVPLDWIPVDIVGDIIAELTVPPPDSSPELLEVYNICNPDRTPWDLFALRLQSQIGPDAKFVPLADWIHALERMKEGPSDVLTPGVVRSEWLSTEPALKLLPAFKRLLTREQDVGGIVLPKFDTSNAVARSKAMAGLQPIDARTIDSWIEQCKL